MNKVIALSIILSIILISSVSALCELDDAYIGSFPKNTCVDLWQTCPDCSFVNISQILYPNSTVAVSQVAMLQFSTNFNYTFCNTVDNGFYVYKTYGNSSANGICTQNVKFLITPNGEEPTIAKAIFYVILLGLLLFFLVLIFWAHMQDQTEIARFWWFAFMWIPLWAILFIGWSMAKDFLTSQGAIQGVLFYAWLTVGVSYPIFLLILTFYTFYWVYQQKEVQRLLTRGFTLEDAQGRVKGRGRGMG